MVTVSSSKKYALGILMLQNHNQNSEWGPKFGIKTRTPTDWIGYFCMLDFEVQAPLIRIG